MRSPPRRGVDRGAGARRLVGGPTPCRTLLRCASKERRRCPRREASRSPKRRGAGLAPGQRWHTLPLPGCVRLRAVQPWELSGPSVDSTRLRSPSGLAHWAARTRHLRAVADCSLPAVAWVACAPPPNALTRPDNHVLRRELAVTRPIPLAREVGPQVRKQLQRCRRSRTRAMRAPGRRRVRPPSGRDVRAPLVTFVSLAAPPNHARREPRNVQWRQRPIAGGMPLRRGGRRADRQGPCGDGRTFPTTLDGAQRASRFVSDAVGDGRAPHVPIDVALPVYFPCRSGRHGIRRQSTVRGGVPLPSHIRCERRQRVGDAHVLSPAERASVAEPRTIARLCAPLMVRPFEARPPSGPTRSEAHVQRKDEPVLRRVPFGRERVVA
jgi:hypothetical protein